ncbi:MAG: RsmD family RNA methyltransferase [Planctomycetes bacterium]|nr:RsmD family RNA methyltransferase [Planctomycetota bacterium]
MTGLRIIAGTYKGRRLLAPPGLATRPLPDRIKQSLFDWLGQDLTGSTVADTCAGSGSFGCEAASRGATQVHLVEPSAHALSVLRANLRGLGNPPAIVIHPRPFQAVLPTLRDLDLVFCDPPFPWYRDEPETLTALLTLAMNALARGGQLLVRGERGETLPPLPSGLRRDDERTYGRSWVLLLKRKEAVPPASGPSFA